MEFLIAGYCGLVRVDAGYHLFLRNGSRRRREDQVPSLLWTVEADVSHGGKVRP